MDRASVNLNLNKRSSKQMHRIEIGLFAFTKYCDLETPVRVIEVHWK